jgi:hypothetical protein
MIEIEKCLKSFFVTIQVSKQPSFTFSSPIHAAAVYMSHKKIEERPKEFKATNRL